MDRIAVSGLRTSYRALEPNHIRILCLEPGKIGQPLQADLEHMTIDQVFPTCHGTDPTQIPNGSNDGHANYNSSGNFHTEDYSTNNGDVSDHSHSNSMNTHSSTTGSNNGSRSSVRSKDGDVQGAHSYEAISYAWGELDYCRKLTLAEHGVLKIRPSLFGALQHLRQKDVTRRLWVDAVCIDQSNNLEKAAQVTRMAEIFGRAKSVLVWIGEADTDTLAFATMSALMSYSLPPGRVERPTEKRHHLESVFARPLSCSCCGIPVPSQASVDEGLAALADLFSRKYFSRLWVLQEISKCPSIILHSGCHQMTWDNLDTVKIRMEVFDPSQARSPVHTDWDATQAFRWMRTENMPESRFMVGLLLSSSRVCYDPRDRIYAIANVFNLADTEDFRPDYEIDPVILYRNVTARCLEDCTLEEPNAHRALFLAFAGTESPAASVDQRPSWVPHFHYFTARSHAKFNAYNMRMVFYRRQPWLPRFHCTIAKERSNELLVRARLCGNVVDILDSSSYPVPWPTVVGSKASSPRSDAFAIWFDRCRCFVSSWSMTPMSLRDLYMLMSRSQGVLTFEQQVSAVGDG